MPDTRRVGLPSTHFREGAGTTIPVFDAFACHVMHYETLQRVSVSCNSTLRTLDLSYSQRNAPTPCETALAADLLDSIHSDHPALTALSLRHTNLRNCDLARFAQNERSRPPEARHLQTLDVACNPQLTRVTCLDELHLTLLTLKCARNLMFPKPPGESVSRFMNWWPRLPLLSTLHFVGANGERECISLPQFLELRVSYPSLVAVE